MNPFPIRRLNEKQECANCRDLGVISVTESDSTISTLMLCDCDEGRAQDWPIQRWERRFAQFYRRERCPIDWFKPDDGETMQSKVDYWIAKLKIAEGYWKQVREESGVA